MTMRAKVTAEGVTVPKEFFESAGEVEISRENGAVILRPVDSDPIVLLGASPVKCGLQDASENHDQYLTGDME
jgi:virulence-associated protein VagC